ncbi:hypothetical protein [Planktothrix mougeotii]|uniref:Uncharacterized protein n=1 Tax=Planktothrix mougeotii LEGE 06226 TaxID=1828728 RepID=A0ABR9UDW0_9CYAN|nr:hypothetical protein [Planktothrix mougeotii]MBE9144639.1 hypothetical protein [Planktothrix mougeotii LEGE 06226]
MYDQLLKQFPQLNYLGEVTINFASGIARNTATQEVIAHAEQILACSDVATYAEIVLSSAGTVIVNSIDIKKTLTLVKQIHSLSAINIALAGVNLGVNLVGYYLISSKLDNLDKQLFTVQNQIESLIKNEQRKLLSESKLLIKHSLSLIQLLEDYGFSENTALSIELLLDKQENHLKELISLHNNQEQISLSLDQIYIIYSAYINLFKAYLTAIYLKQQNLTRQKNRIQESHEINKLLSSKAILFFIYQECLFNPRRILTESEIQEVINLYQFYTQSYNDNLKNHYDFLITTPLDKYQDFQQKTNNAYQPMIWIKH